MAHVRSSELSPEGEKRAAALPGLFKKSDARPDPFPAPDFIFAAKDSKHSHRPMETVAPLAKSLDLKVNDEYAEEDFGLLAHELFHKPKYAGKTVLICWHHGKIPALADKLAIVGAPNKWHGDVFDKVWQADYDKYGKVEFRMRPQMLMPGDK